MTEFSGIEATLTRKGTGFYSDPAWRDLGNSLHRALASDRTRSGIHEGLWLLSTIPINAEILRAVSNLAIETLNDEFVFLRISETRTAWVFNPLHGLPSEVKQSFLNFLRDSNDQKQIVSELLRTARIPRNIDPMTILGNAFEAVSYHSFEPIICQAASGSEGIGQPFLIDLSLSKGWISKKTRRRPKVSANYPAYFRLLNAFKAARPQSREEVRQLLKDLKKQPSLAPVSDGDQIARTVFFEYFEEQISGKHLVESSSHQRYMQEIPYLISVLKKEVPQPKSLNSLKVTALGILRKWSEFKSEIDRCLASTGRSESSTLQIVVGLKASREWFGFNSTYPEIADIRACATKILAIVLFAGRRIRCLADAQPRHFRVNSEGRIDLWIESTKVKDGGKKWFPLSGVLPDDDLDFVLRWRESLAGDRPLCGISGLESRNLIAIAGGISDEEMFDKRKYHSVASTALMASLRRKRGVKTHDPRRIFANWFPIRCLIEGDPTLMKSPLIVRNIPAEYLTPTARSRLSELIAAKEFDDPLIAATALMGNLSTKQLRKTYVRMWPLWMQLRSESMQGAI